MSALRVSTLVWVILVAVPFAGCDGTGTAEPPEDDGETDPPPKITCIATGDQNDINDVLTGPGSVAVLCQNAEFQLTAPVVFTAEGQEMHTEGFPTDDRRALLKIASSSVVTAVDMANERDFKSPLR